jgi:hypothetical protein
MQGHRLVALFGLLLVLGCGFSGADARADTQGYTISATNVTMPASGNGDSKFTVTNIPITGTISIGISYVGTNAEARIPTCGNFPPVLYSVKAGGTLTGTIACYPYGAALPASLQRKAHRSGCLPASGLALACALLLGFGFQRRARRWLVLPLLAMGTLAGLAGISACGGNPNAMTPGTYQYTISADNEGTVTPLGTLATTTISVTVP